MSILERRRTLVFSGLIVAALVLLGRLSGFAREWLLAVRAGASGEADLAIVLLTFPDLMIGILLGGGLAATLVPRFTSLPAAERSALLLRLGAWIGGLFVLLAAAIALAASPLLTLLLPGKAPEFLEAARQPFVLVAIALPLAALSGIVVAYLNAHRHFALGACGTLLFNACLILALLFWPGEQLVLAIVAGVLAGAALRLLAQLAGTRRNWEHPAWSGGKIDRALLGRFAACFGFTTLLVLLPPLARALASYGEPGSVALFNFAHKLVELPMGVLIGAISTVLLPTLAASHAREGVADTQAQAAAAIRLTLQCALAISIPVCFFADAIVHMAFFKAAFTPAQFTQLALLASIGFLALPLQGLLNIFGTTLAAIGQTRSLLMTAGLMLATFGLSATWAQTHWQLPGLMGAYVLSYLLGAAILSQQLAQRLGSLVWRLALRRGLTTLLLPVLLALGLALVCDQLATTAIWRLSAAVLVFLAFFAATLALDPQGLRRQLTRSKDTP